MAVNYAVEYADKIAERFHKASITDAACGNEYSFVGAKTVKIYSVDTVPETDYNRTADGNRFGVPQNLGDTIQEMTMTQARSFTFVIEALDNSDQAIEKSAGKALRRQLDEVTVPNMDKYRLKKWSMGANTIHQLTSAPTKSTIVEAIIDVNSKMTDALVPLENRWLYIPTEQYKLLKQNPDFISVDTLGERALAKGEVGQVDGCRVIPIPKNYLPEGVYFMIKYKGSSVDPVKMRQYDVLPKVQGYSGPVVQGLTYYDAFVLGTKGDGIGVCGNSTMILPAPTMSVSSHVVTITDAGSNTYLYTVDGSNPRYSGTAMAYPSGGVTLSSGQTMRCIQTKDGCVGLEGTQEYE